MAAVSKTLTSILVIGAAVAVNAIPGVGQFLSGSLIAAGLGKAAALAVTSSIITSAAIAGLASAALLLGLGPGGVKPETADMPLKTARPPRMSAYGGPTKFFGAYGLYETATNGTAVDVYAVHDGAIEEVVEFYLGDEAVTLTGNIVDEGADGRYRDDAVKLYWTEGADTETAFAAVTSLIPAWDSAHRGDGIVAMALTAESVKVKHFQETYPQGQVPIPAMVAKWQLCPDPAAEDPTDDTGWTWTENPVRHLLHYKLVREGVDYATKIAPAIASWITAAADCEDAMSLAAGGTEARYRSCVAHKHTDQHKDVIGAIVATFDGWIAPRADGAFVVYSGRYTAPTVDIGSTEIVSYTWDGVGIDDDQAVNEIIISYVSAEHDYNTPEGEAWRDEADISARGQVLSQPLDVQVPSFPQTRRLAKRKMKRIMAAARGTVTTNVAGRAVRGQRFINLHIEEAGTVFYSGPAEITALTRNIATGGVTFSWVAADPDIDDWDPATEEGQSAAAGERVAPAALAAPVITGVAVIAGPRLEITVTSPDRADLTWFGHTRVAGATAWGTDLEYSEIASGTSIVLVTDIVPADATVEVEVAYQVGDGRFSAWSNTESSTTGFSPAMLFGGGEAGAWYDASDLASMFQDAAGTVAAAVNSPVGRINDKSGNGHNATQATAGNRPTLRQSGSTYYLEFDGTNDGLLSLFALPQPWDRISAIRQISWTLSDRILSGNTAVGELYQKTATPTLGIYDGTVGTAETSAAAVGANVVITERHNGALSQIAVNNGAYATGDAGTTATDGLSLGSRGGATFNSNVRIYGVIMREMMTSAQIASAREYMAAKAGVAL